jgi:hypothetical protein
MYVNDLLYVQLLAKLLPALVQKLATAQPKTRAKVGHSQRHLPGVWCMQQAACSACMHFNGVVELQHLHRACMYVRARIPRPRLAARQPHSSRKRAVLSGWLNLQAHTSIHRNA